MFFTLQLNLLWIRSRNNVNLIGHVTGYKQCGPLLVSTLKLCVNAVSSSCVSWLIYINVLPALPFTGDLLTYFHLTCLESENEFTLKWSAHCFWHGVFILPPICYKKNLNTQQWFLFSPEIMTQLPDIIHRPCCEQSEGTISSARATVYPCTEGDVQLLDETPELVTRLCYCPCRLKIVLYELDFVMNFRTGSSQNLWINSIMTVSDVCFQKAPERELTAALPDKIWRSARPHSHSCSINSRHRLIRFTASPDRHLALFVFPVNDAILAKRPRCTSENCSWCV